MIKFIQATVAVDNASQILGLGSVYKQLYKLKLKLSRTNKVEEIELIAQYEYLKTSINL